MTRAAAARFPIFGTTADAATWMSGPVALPLQFDRQCYSNHKFRRRQHLSQNHNEPIR